MHNIHTHLHLHLLELLNHVSLLPSLISVPILIAQSPGDYLRPTGGTGPYSTLLVLGVASHGVRCCCHDAIFGALVVVVGTVVVAGEVVSVAPTVVVVIK